MFHVHTIHYDALPDWFVAFGLFDKEKSTFIPFMKGLGVVEQAGLATVPIIAKTRLKDQDDLLSRVTTSRFGHEMMEGIVLHSIDDTDKVKYVTDTFKRSIDNSRHWRKCNRVKNRLERVT